MQKELKDIERDKESGVRVELIGNSIRHLTGYVNGTSLKEGNSMLSQAYDGFKQPSYFELRALCQWALMQHCSHSLRKFCDFLII